MTEVSFTNLVIVAAAAFAAPLGLGLFPKVRLPAVVLEILLGIALGPSGLRWVKSDLPVRVLALVGLAFLLSWRAWRWISSGCGSATPAGGTRVRATIADIGTVVLLSLLFSEKAAGLGATRLRWRQVYTRPRRSSGTSAGAAARASALNPSSGCTASARASHRCCCW